jgi:hypothetical protein
VEIAQPFQRTPSRRGNPKCLTCVAQYRTSMLVQESKHDAVPRMRTCRGFRGRAHAGVRNPVPH